MQLRNKLLTRYFGRDPVIRRESAAPTAVTDDKDTNAMTNNTADLYKVQTSLNAAGASNLVIDLIVQNPSQKVFIECVELSKALLDGGNTVVQVTKTTYSTFLIFTGRKNFA